VLRDGRYRSQRENTQTRQLTKELHSRRGRRGHYTLARPNQAPIFNLATAPRRRVRKPAMRYRILIPEEFRAESVT
jgi:hypothetical protein